MPVNDDDDRSEPSTSSALLDLLRQHAGGDGEVDVSALVAGGADLRQLRAPLDQLRRQRQLLLEFAADRIDRITLLGPARRAPTRSAPDPTPGPDEGTHPAVT